MKVIALLIIALLVAGCQQSDSAIASGRQWKADSNNLLGDFITFSKDKNNGLFIDNDTIYSNGKPKALLVSISYHIDHYVMIVHSIDHKTSARYVDKGSAK